VSNAVKNRGKVRFSEGKAGRTEEKTVDCRLGADMNSADPGIIIMAVINTIRLSDILSRVSDPARYRVQYLPVDLIK
jgi:hypothetical protein